MIVKFYFKNHSLFCSSSSKMDGGRDTLTYYKSNKGQRKLMDEGYVYRKNRTINETVYWLCEQNLYHCNGRLIVKNEVVTKRQPEKVHLLL